MALLDEKSIKIIEALERDGRTPYSKLAKELGISDTAVKKRIAALEKAGIILGYKAKINEKAIGRKCALIILNVKPDVISHIVEFISNTDDVCDAFMRYGSIVTVYLVIPLDKLPHVKEKLSEVSEISSLISVVERLK